MYTSCKTSYTVLSHSHFGLGQFFGGGAGGGWFVEIPGGASEKKSLPILGLQRLASLLRFELLQVLSHGLERSQVFKLGKFQVQNSGKNLSFIFCQIFKNFGRVNYEKELLFGEGFGQWKSVAI